MSRDPGNPTEALLAEQRRFYDLRAPDFGDPSKPDRPVHGCMDAASIAEVVEEFRPAGEVLELACGEGAFTRELVRFATSVTAVDSSPAMLRRNRTQTIGSVSYVEA